MRYSQRQSSLDLFDILSPDRNIITRGSRLQSKAESKFFWCFVLCNTGDPFSVIFLKYFSWVIRRKVHTSVRDSLLDNQTEKSKGV